MSSREFMEFMVGALWVLVGILYIASWSGNTEEVQEDGTTRLEDVCGNGGTDGPTGAYYQDDMPRVRGPTRKEF